MEGLNVNVAEQKIRIVSYIKTNGPVVAQHIPKRVEIPGILASALLSELLRDKVIKASHMRVGGSQLYYVDGQEEKLSNFTNFLELKEREAFKILKEKGVVQDYSSEPAIRVAYRNMKDFAVPLIISRNNEEKLFWKFYTLHQAELSSKLNELLLEKREVKVGKTAEVPKTEVKQETREEHKEKINEFTHEKTEKKVRKRVVRKISPLVEKWAAENKVEIEQNVGEDGKSFKAVISFESSLGNLKFLLVAKDKKSINEGDLVMAYQEGLNKKLPVIFLTSGKLTKKGNETVEEFNGQLVIRKL